MEKLPGVDPNESEYVELNIFDFDGTLFRSPCPSPKVWDKSSLGKIKSLPGPQHGGLGWFQDVATLSPPTVPYPPPAELFIDHVVTRVLQSMQNEPLEPITDAPSNRSTRCVTVLLTGRSVNYTEIVTSIIDHRNLKFDRIGLKPLSGKLATMDFKQTFIKDLIRDYKPSFVNIFEDRVDHVKKFEQFFQAVLSPRKIGWRIHDVSHLDGESYLTREEEIKLISQLIDTHGDGQYCIEETISYTAVVLDHESHQKLLKAFPIPIGWQTYAHHMTVCLGALKPALENPALVGLKEERLGQRTEIIVEGIGESERAMAVKVRCKTVPSLNTVPHITLAVAPGSRPVDSNYIHTWVDLPRESQFSVFGTLEQVGTLSIKSRPKPAKGKGGSKVPIGALVKKHMPELDGKQISSEISEITSWMNKMYISSPGQVEQYIIEKKKQRQTVQLQEPQSLAESPSKTTTSSISTPISVSAEASSAEASPITESLPAPAPESLQHE